MGSIIDRIADKEREEEEAKRKVSEALKRKQIKDEMDATDFEAVEWLWEHRNKIWKQRKLIDILA